MAKDDLTGNMATEKMLEYFQESRIETGLNKDEFYKAISMATEVFN